MDVSTQKGLITIQTALILFMVLGSIIFLSQSLIATKKDMSRNLEITSLKDLK